MTVLINQKTGYDCVLAAIAMAAGKTAWEDLWTADDLDEVNGKGVSDIEPWMKRAGFTRLTHYKTVYLHACDQEQTKDLLWRRKALLSIDSLNNEHGSHMVYWDGERIWDPHEKHDDYLFHRILTGVCLRSAYLLNV